MSTINEDLLAAAKAYRDKSYPFLPDNSTRQEEYAAAELATQMDKAIAAAEREITERLKPVNDDAWLSSLSTSQDRAGLYFGPRLFWSYSGRCFWLGGYQIDIANRGQLIDLLSGLGIEWYRND